jgi:hypothetical protein
MLHVGSVVGLSTDARMPVEMVIKAACILLAFCFLMSAIISKHLAQVS